MQEDELLIKLYRSTRIIRHLEVLSDKELASLLLNDVWAELDFTSRAAAIIDEAIRRLDPTLTEDQKS